MRSFPNKYNKDRHEFNVHGTWLNEDPEPLSVKPNTLGGVHSRDSEPLSVKPNLLEDVSEPPKILNPLEEDEGTEDEDTESNDSEPPKKKRQLSESESEEESDEDSEPPKKKKKKQLSDSESEEESDEEREFNKYDVLVANELIDIAGEEGDYGKAWLNLLDIFHWMKKSIIYENIRSAARHYDDIARASRAKLMKKAVAFQIEDINEIMRRTVALRKRYEEKIAMRNGGMKSCY